MIPIVFVTSLAVFYAVNPRIFSFIEFGSFFAYNLEGTSHQYIISYINYLTVGTLIVLFGIGLILLLPKSLTNNLGAIVLIIIGLLWVSLAFFPQTATNDFSGYLLIVALLIASLSCIVQLSLCNDIHKLVESKLIKTSLWLAGILVIIEFLFCIFIPDFPIGIPVFSVLFFITNIGIIGYHLSKDYDFIDSE